MIKTDELWEALGRVYLTDYELMEFAQHELRKEKIIVIKKRLFDDVWKRMLCWDEKNPPFINPPEESAFIKYDRKTIIKEVEKITNAFLELKNDKFLLFVNKNLHKRRKRTYIAHEIGHTFFYDLNEKTIKPYLRGLPYSGPKIFNWEIEGLAYEIGRFILIPSKVLKRKIPKKPSLNEFKRLCNQFIVTKEIMARRLLYDTNLLPAIMIFYSTNNIKNGEYNFPQNPTQEIFKSPDFKNLSIKMIWQSITPFLELAYHNQGESFNFEDFSEIKKPILKIRNESWNIETLCESPERIYILLYPISLYENTHYRSINSYNIVK